ncbi:MAG TPA: RNA polymerase sigma factor [Gemmataceae bacterium]|jgi:RNA polymerase sigma factor (sigma-70 family)
MPSSRLDVIFGAALRSLRYDARSDAELLTRFLDQRDEMAFEALVLRHTPAVRAACRGWLRSETDIDDAAQATFLVLVRRAVTIRDRAVLGRWLYRVAVNVARRLRNQQRTSGPLPEDLPGREPAADDGLQEVLAEEIARLPEKYRLPVYLCYSSGLTTTEAAHRLGWPKGTVLTRLARARERLQKSLTRRGVAPAVLTGLLAATSAPVVRAQWARVTALAAKSILSGEGLAPGGVSGRAMSLMQGVVRAMFYDRLKYVALTALLAVGVAGFGIGRWAPAANGPKEEHKPLSDGAGPRVALQQTPKATKERDDAPKADEERPGTIGRRREAVIRLPSGTFTKEIEAAPYGSGRLTWTYEDERVLGLIEGSVMGFQFELATEAEYSLSSNGTIYGLITSARLNRLRVPDGEEYAELKPFIDLWPAVEPLINDVLTDLPFSYQFRVQGDRLIISNFRILLAGPNPLGKAGGLLAADSSHNEFVILACFQALGTALEGTFTAPDAHEKATPSKLPLPSKLRGSTGRKKIK